MVSLSLLSHMLSALLVLSATNTISYVSSTPVEETSVPERRSLGTSANATSRINVIIIGAGIAGIAAANQLALQGGGNFSVTVLEARERTGGRMYSRFGTLANGQQVGPIEYGATWIQTYKGNPVYDLAQRLGVTTVVDTGKNEQYFYANGSSWSDADEAQSESDFNKLLDAATSAAEKQDADISLDAAFRLADPEKYQTPDIQWQCAQQIEDEYASRMTEFSAQYGFNDKAYSGADCYVPNGYHRIPQELLKEANASGYVTVHLDSPVASVEYTRSNLSMVWLNPGSYSGPEWTLTAASQPQSVRVTTQGGQTYQGHAVIVTVPLGVLKASSIKFVPALSPSKLDAITRIGFGHLNKVILFFDKVRWDENTTFFGIQDKSVRNRFPHVISLWPVWKIPALQMACSGDVAVSVDTMSDSQVVAMTLAKVRSFIPALDGVSPVDAWISRWGAEPYTMGAYSFAKVGIAGSNGKASDFDTLASPLDWPVLFAGEATTDAFGTVHSAYLSGLREAQRLIDISQGKGTSKTAEQIQQLSSSPRSTHYSFPILAAALSALIVTFLF